MKTPKAIEVIQEYQRHIATKNKAVHNRVDMPDAVELDKALSKAVEVMDNKYWEARCKLAEAYINESPCDPDIYAEQYQAYLEWQSFIEEVTND